MAMTNFVWRCLHGEPPVIYGSGEQTRDFTYVEDIRRVTEQLLTDDNADGEILNNGSTDNIDIRTLGEIILEEIDPTLDIVFDDPREGDAEHTHMSIFRKKIICWDTSRAQIFGQESRSLLTGTSTIRSHIIFSLRVLNS
jgi:nucleoside-diphosphate-sugar epimerase